MSWGERSCKNKPCPIPDECSFETCNVDCRKYKRDKTIKPDSVSQGEKNMNVDTIVEPKPKKANQDKVKLIPKSSFGLMGKKEDIGEEAMKRAGRKRHRETKITKFMIKGHKTKQLREVNKKGKGGTKKNKDLDPKIRKEQDKARDERRKRNGFEPLKK